MCRTAVTVSTAALLLPFGNVMGKRPISRQDSLRFVLTAECTVGWKQKPQAEHRGPRFLRSGLLVVTTHCPGLRPDMIHEQLFLLTLCYLKEFRTLKGRNIQLENTPQCGVCVDCRSLNEAEGCTNVWNTFPLY